MSARSEVAAAPIAVYYEHPSWFNPLFQELERRHVPFERLHVGEHTYDVADPRPPYPLLFNRISPSAFTRGLPGAISYTLQYLAHLEKLGVRVINGHECFANEISKARQLAIFAEHGLQAPRSRLIHNAAGAAKAAEALSFPVIFKPNIGGSGTGVRRFETPEELREAAATDDLDFGLDRTALVQEFIPAEENRITRVEVLGGKYLYAIRIYMQPGGDYNLCPGSICKCVGGAELQRSAYPEDAPKKDLVVEGYEPPAEVIEQVERAMAAAKVDVGGIEYITDARDGGRYFYDLNALSNFVADAPNVIGFDPFVRLVDYLVAEAERAANGNGAG
jgi:hypothetical protein